MVEFDLKQQRKKAHRRLIGAIVFAVFIAFIVPKLLRYQPNHHPEEVVLTLPKEEPAPSSIDAASVPVKSTTPNEEMQMPIQNKPNLQEKEPPQATGQNIIVQLGAFSSMANAKSLQTRARSFGVKTYIEQIQGDNGKVMVRVRAGPFATMEDAKKVSNQLKAAGLPAVVIAD
jgi:DedD protein